MVRRNGRSKGGQAKQSGKAVDSRGGTTPPALNFTNYLTIRALTYAVNIVYRPPACRWRRGVHGSGLLFALWQSWLRHVFLPVRGAKIRVGRWVLLCDLKGAFKVVVGR